MARCANTGITAFIDRFGRVYREIPWWEERTLAADVPLESRLTIYTRNPDLFPKVLSLLSAAFIVASFFGGGFVRR
jgi:apolipoprotein N-acyltransferase